MAEKRMFAKTIIDSDSFLDMPTTAQLLYFHLCMRADDDGFINNPKRIMRDVRCSEDDIRILIAKKYIIPFESGVIVIRHWRLHNYIRKDRKKPSSCEEVKLLKADEQGIYQLDGQMSVNCQSNDGQMTDKWQHRLVENRLDKSSREEDATTTIDQEVLNLYQDNIHPITPIELEKLADDIEKYGAKWCIEAINRAVVRNRRTLGYVEGILHNWETNGFDDGSTKQEQPNTPKPKYADEVISEAEREWMRERYAELDAELEGR